MFVCFYISYVHCSLLCRYAASMADPPRGGYYPSSPSNQPSRQYQFQGTNPWEREEREKVCIFTLCEHCSNIFQV